LWADGKSNFAVRDGRLKEGERREVEKHLAACAACRLRVNEFRAVSGLLDELPVIEPSRRLMFACRHVWRQSQ